MRTTRWLAILWLLGACSTVTPTTPGEVDCATDDDCPGTFVCEVNKCFPADYTGTYCEFIECDANATCAEGPPPSCTCDAGFVGDGETCTADPDECAAGTDNCSADATCTNTDAGFDCECNAGFTGDGVTCTDTNECTAGTDNCSDNGTCTNTPGGFDCACDPGFTGDGLTCTDVDECGDGSNNCSADATCANTFGGFDCTCNGGFTGDGVTCTDIDECAANPCTPIGGVCTNLPGDFFCSCDVGFYGDGFLCLESVGQVIWMGHDFFSRNLDVDRLIGNAVAQATTLGPIQIVGYSQYADQTMGGEVENTDAGIAARMVELGRTAAITHLNDYLLLDLSTADVLLVYEMENGGDALAIGAAWTAAVQTFLDGGGVVIVLDHYSSGWQILDTAGVMQFLGQSSGYGDIPITVTVPGDPLAAGVAATYTGTNGTASYWTNDGTIVATDPAGIPVVVHKNYTKPRFTGAFGMAWEPLASNTEPGYSLMTDHPAHIANIYNMYDSTGQSYSPATNTWTPLVTVGPPANPWFQMAPVGNYLYGWVAYTTGMWRYDIDADTWVNQATVVGGGTNEYSMAAVDEAGIVYGYMSNGNVVAYNPQTNAITNHATGIPALRMGNGSLYETRLVYDPATRSLYLGGYGSAELYRFDLTTNATTQLTSIPESQLNDIFCGDRAGHIYAAGDAGGQTMFQYDIASDSWSSIPNFPIDHGNNGSCTVSAGGYLYVSSGGPDLHRLPLF